jgi:hypothetical protein
MIVANGIVGERKVLIVGLTAPDLQLLADQKRLVARLEAHGMAGTDVLVTFGATDADVMAQLGPRAPGAEAG